MDKIELRGKEIVEVVSSLVLGEVSYTIDDSSRSFLFKIENRGHKWVARGDICDVMDIPPHEYGWIIATAYRDDTLNMLFRKEHLSELLDSRVIQPL